MRFADPLWDKAQHCLLAAAGNAALALAGLRSRRAGPLAERAARASAHLAELSAAIGTETASETARIVPWFGVTIGGDLNDSIRLDVPLPEDISVENLHRINDMK